MTNPVTSYIKFKNTIKYLCTLFPNPFVFYTFFENYIITNSLDINHWEQKAHCIISFIKKKKLKKLNIVLDLLKWDFCNYNNDYRYPELIKPDNYIMLKKKCQKIVDKNCELHINLKQIKVFKAKSKKFKKEYFSNKDMIKVFIGTNQVYQFNAVILKNQIV